MDLLLGPVDDHPAPSRQIHRRGARRLRVWETSRSFHPGAGIRLVAGVEHPAGEILEEDPGVDVALDPLGDDVEGRAPGRSGWRPGWTRASRRGSRPPRASAQHADGRSSRYGLTPQARSATASRSADSRPSPTSRPTSSDIGMVRPAACGTAVQMIRRRWTS